jgi:DNA-damage-inducible protein D
MNSELIHTLTGTFEGHAQQTDGGVEYWLARDIQHLLGYAKWDNFTNVLSKAKTACEVSGHRVSDHFADVGKMVQMPKTAEKEVPDLMLTRFACYLIAQNGAHYRDRSANGAHYRDRSANGAHYRDRSANGAHYRDRSANGAHYRSPGQRPGNGAPKTP